MVNRSQYVSSRHADNSDYLRIDGICIPYEAGAWAVNAVSAAIEKDEPLNLAFCNANTLLMALRRPDYMNALREFLVLNDGIGVDLCSRLLRGRSFPENLNGTDFVPRLLNDIERPLRVFLLGSRPGIVDQAAHELATRFPRHALVGAQHGFFGQANTASVIAAINASQADIVLVGMGNPLQEEFIVRHRKEIEAPVLIAVGAFLDFTAGKVSRAPTVVRRAHMEWVWRLLQEPKRLGRRYTVDIVEFFYRIIRLRLVAAGGEAARRSLDPGHQLRPDP